MGVRALRISSPASPEKGSTWKRATFTPSTLPAHSPTAISTETASTSFPRTAQKPASSRSPSASASNKAVPICLVQRKEERVTSLLLFNSSPLLSPLRLLLRLSFSSNRQQTPRIEPSFRPKPLALFASGAAEKPRILFLLLSLSLSVLFHKPKHPSFRPEPLALFASGAA